jgi:hypothetical protein
MEGGYSTIEPLYLGCTFQRYLQYRMKFKAEQNLSTKVSQKFGSQMLGKTFNMYLAKLSNTSH